MVVEFDVINTIRERSLKQYGRMQNEQKNELGQGIELKEKSKGEN